MNIILAKCIEHAAKNNTIKVLTPRLKWDAYLKMHFRENDEIQALDPEGKCRPGDWILLKELDERISLHVKHSVERIVYKNGRVIDPVTGKRCHGWHLKDDIGSESKLFGLKPLTERFNDPDKTKLKLN